MFPHLRRHFFSLIKRYKDDADLWLQKEQISVLFLLRTVNFLEEKTAYSVQRKVLKISSAILGSSVI